MGCIVIIGTVIVTVVVVVVVAVVVGVVVGIAVKAVVMQRFVLIFRLGYLVAVLGQQVLKHVGSCSRVVVGG